MWMKWHLIGVFCLLTLVAAALPEGNFDWALAEEFFPGIRHTAVTVAEPRPMAIHAVRIDLSQPGLRFHTTPADPAAGEPMPEYPQYRIATRRQTTRQYLEQARRPVADGGYGLNMVLAVNASPWTPWEKPFNHPYAEQLGLVVAQGQVVSEATTPVTVFAIRRDGTPDICVVAPEDERGDFELVLTGFGQVLTDGVVSGDETLHPRTLFGIDPEKQYVYFVTVDGRQPEYSEGIGTQEAAHWLKYFGAWNAINMDGGGSTQLAVYAPADATIRLLNRTPDNNTERSVGNNLGVYYSSAADVFKWLLAP